MCKNLEKIELENLHWRKIMFLVFFIVLYVENRYIFIGIFPFLADCYIQGQEEENVEFRQMFIYTFGERKKIEDCRVVLILYFSSNL